MIRHVNAIYENGVLRPLEPLDLKDHEIVALSIDKVADNGRECSAGGQTLFDLLDEVGLIGCVKDAPSDLSTSPKHLEGFGESGK